MPHLDTASISRFTAAILLATGLGIAVGGSTGRAGTSDSESRLMEVSRKGMVSSVKISSESAVAIMLALEEFKKLRHSNGSWADVARGNYPIEVVHAENKVEIIIVQTPPFRLDDAYSFEVDTKTYSVELVGSH